MKHLIKVMFISFILLSGASPECTVAVVGSLGTSDGRPLLWKNRDSGYVNNEYVYFSGQPFNYIGVINSGDSSQVWMGINEIGFAIMNSESKDLEGDEYDDEGYLMKHVLENCADIDDFRDYLDSTNITGRKVTSNFGVIDAYGGAGFFETGNRLYSFFNANDTSDAPQYFLVRANFAETGSGSGYGYERFHRATALLNHAYDNQMLSHRYILQSVAKDIATSECDPYPLQKCCKDTLSTSNTINRYRTVSCTVFQGVRPGEDPAKSTMWCILGEPIAGIAIPLWVKSGYSGGGSGSEINKITRRIKDNLYPHTTRKEYISVKAVSKIYPMFIKMEALNLEYTRQFLYNSPGKTSTTQSFRKIQQQIGEHTYQVLQEGYNIFFSGE